MATMIRSLLVCAGAIGAVSMTVSFTGCGSDSATTTPPGDDASVSGDDGGDEGAAKATCGNSILEGTEECDDGNTTNGDGCENDCGFTCIAADPKRNHCDDANACNGTETCTAMHKCQAGTPIADGMACGAGKVCTGGNCMSGSCGDKIVSAPEECDDGNSTTGDGCEGTCKFSCLSTDTTRKCTPADPCAGQGTCNDNTHVCAAGTPLANGTACGTGKTCKAGVCTLLTCGNGTIDPGETCEPPSTATCDATCHTIVVAVCGNGVLDMGEQCDDGNTRNLDGCDKTCKYEVVGRMTSIAIQGGAAPAGCTPTTNRLGSQSITGTGLGSINQSLTDGITAGTTNVTTMFLGLDDLTGVADSNGLTIGIVSGSLDPAKGAWPMNNPIDWWFYAAGSNVAMGAPTGILTNGTLAARALKAGPSDVTLTLLLAGSPALLEMRSARIAATLNGTPAPNVPAPPPAMLAAGLTVFQTFTGSGTGQGLCGNITVQSLAQIPIPQSLATNGSNACGACMPGSKTYTYCGMGMPVGPNCNSLLDALVGGCKVVACLVAAINPQQPDVPGTGTATLTLGAGNKVPAAQSTGNTNAYSSYMKFDGNRAHLTTQTCTVTADCQTGLTCQTGVCK